MPICHVSTQMKYQMKSGLSVAQLWKSLPLIHYKDLKYNIVDYVLISALTYNCVFREKKAHLPSIPVGSAD